MYFVSIPNFGVGGGGKSKMVGYTTTVLSTSYYVTPAVYEPPMQTANNYIGMYNVTLA